MDIESLFDSFRDIKVVVVGDVMLDTYWWGKVERISPEAPVPVVAIDHKEYRLGGAGNVALNLIGLDAEVHVLTVTGDDEDGLLLRKMMLEKKMSVKAMHQSKKRITTNKIRIISRNQQMMRLDKEISSDLDKDTEKEFLTLVKKYLKAVQPQLLIFEDYNKGILTEKIIYEVINICKKNNIITAVDPKRKNFFAYKGVDIFKPNLKEVYDAFNMIDVQVDERNLQKIHTLLFNRLQHQISYITLGDKGAFYQSKKSWEIFPAHVRNVADVSGAGDTVIAVAALVYAATRDKNLMAEIGNIAGGLVCEQVGTVAINKEKLIAECKKLFK